MAHLKELVVVVGVFGGLFDFLAGLGQEFFGAAGVASEIVVVVLLGAVDFDPGLLDELLGGAHVAVAFADVDRRRAALGSDHGSEAEGRAERPFKTVTPLSAPERPGNLHVM